jgi:asparagine synthase (glutamine-hydrolysing)
VCGIAGSLSRDGSPVTHAAVRAITDALQHRGPDEGAVRLLGRDAGAGRAIIGLGHRRLKVIDLTSAAAQPMRDPDDRGYLVYNGELYNAEEMRRDLQARGVRFRSRSDTEVVLMALLAYEPREALRRMNGMFAFGFWHQERQRLLLARDRFGEKPLYYAVTQHHLVFASEIEALVHHGGVPLDLDPQAVELYLTLGYIPAPWTIYRSVRKLPQACWIEADRGGVEGPRRYYDLEARFAQEPPRRLEEAVRDLLAAAVRRRLESDVPLGAFLSGGVDSSAVVRSMRDAMPWPPRTYSIGIKGARGYDEAPMARRLARELGTDHREIDLDERQLRDEIPTALQAFGEPFADSSAVACSLIARVARRDLTVALSGDGGDEVFGGYRLYRALASAHLIRRLGQPALFALRALIEPFPARYGAGAAGLAHRARKLLDGLSADLAATHAAWMSILSAGERRRLRPDIPDEGLAPAIVEARYRRFGGGIDRTLAVEIDLSLPDDMLAKVDRTSMRHSLEVRSPFLDPALVELSLSLPAAAHFSALSSKRLLRRALRGILPDRVLDAPKRGFEVPVGDWIAEPLADLYREVVTPAALSDVSGLDARVAASWHQSHARRRSDRGRALWALFVLCYWQQIIRPRAAAAAARLDAGPEVIRSWSAAARLS